MTVPVLRYAIRVGLSARSSEAIVIGENMRDPYAVLGVKRDADAGEIKSAWRSIAKKIHPDQNRSDPNAAKLFAEAGEAYEVLKDPKRRSRYDMLSQQGKQGATIQQQRDAAREAAARQKAAEENARKVMEELARIQAEKDKAAAAAKKAEAGSSASSQQQAQNQQQQPPQGAKSENSSRDADAAGSETPEAVIDRIFGAQPQFAPGDAGGGHAASGQYGQNQSSFSSHIPDEASRDEPDRPGARPLPIAAVEAITAFIRRFTGGAPVMEKAPDQFAEAKVSIEDLLKEAWISVPLPEGRDLRFRLEPGATEGQVIRLRGQGFKVPGMNRGDAVVTVRVEPSALFRVVGHDIHTPLAVSLENAVLGCSATAQSPTGPVDVTVPAWSGSDQSIRIPGLGLLDGKGGRGDLVAELRLMLWDKPDDKVTDLMRAMREGLYL